MMASESNAKASTMRLGMCEVCAAKEARYACPKCEVKTCSLPCVQIHKKELSCDGQRDRTKFVPLNEMTAREFMSDYCFLEECTRYAANRKSDQCKRFTHEQRNLPVAQHRMRTAARNRNIQLRLQLPNFSRHKENTTYLNWKLGRFYWRVEWLFANISLEASGSKNAARFVDARCDEEVTLSGLVLKYIDLQHETARDHRKLLANHQTAGIGQLSFWLRAEGVRRSSTRCYPLEATKTLGQNLAGKTIVEFPTIFVTYEPKPPGGYDAIDSGEEQELDEEIEKPPVAKPVQPKAKAVEEDMDVPHDVFQKLAATFVGEDVSESEDDEEFEAFFRQHAEL
ncbi:box C/D snoRNA protein 1 [Drosophila ficusphila]|uniref:box C/D snoRNA protein 1 n=1 Tax=Drosophila ficusphila TaxID=30025 RepID=UPI0007E6E513|nr:box C/D snoRNA protein 1 [Drosophila ficusphila]XP_017045728.1 box C/D snoRNA protein 1 [Drosophila ficusphila]